MADIFQIGDTIKLSGTFTDETGVVMDPTTVTLELTSPTHTHTTYTYPTSPELTKTSTGIYVGRIPVVEPSGRWWWRMVGNGTPSTAEQSSFYVEAVPS